MRESNGWSALVVAAAIVFSGCDREDADPDFPRVVTPPPDDGAAGRATFSDDDLGILAGSGSAGVAGTIACTGSATPGGFGVGGWGGGEISPQFSSTAMRAEKAPPPISGGTLLTSADGLKLIAADPDRDAVYVIDVATRTLERRIELSPSDEPGRVVQDKTGMVHVALRGGRGIASFALAGNAAVRRTEVCDLPRGIGYDGAADRLYLACAEGVLVQIDPLAGKPLKKISLGRDLRDVIVRGNQLFVTRFRSAELLEVDTNAGRVMASHKPPSTMQTETAFVQEDGPNAFCGSGHFEERTNELESAVAWRTVDVPGRGVAMLHQRAGEAEVQVSPGGYGGGGVTCAPGIVHGAISFGDQASSSMELGMSGLFVDLAVDPTGAVMALANPGGWGTGSALMVFSTSADATDASLAGTNISCQHPVMTVRIEGQPTAVAFVSPWLLAVQEREPAAISFVDIRLQTAVPQRLDLLQPTRNDTGHTLFHLTTGAGLACASCHAEAGDDGHVWTFHGIGPRRTQNLRGGILGSEPFHWNGDMKDFPTLVNEVFVGRMTAPQPTVEQADALAKWIDRQPLLHATPDDMTAVARGKTLFESEAVGCTKCHSGARFSNNESADVGTGAMLQVPSLRAISFRAPFMHNGCAPSLIERFSPCGGGDKHGNTSQLQAEQVSDLVAYLESL
jgi:mono/diheme cytochrome c family protein